MHRFTSKRKEPHVFFDDRGFPDAADEWDDMVPAIKGCFIRRRKHPAPSTVDPLFNTPFDESKHGNILCNTLNVSHLQEPFCAQLITLIKKYWGIFNPVSISMSVKDYECVIDTGLHAPTACTNVTYGTLEAPMIVKAIAVLLRLGHIKQIFDGAWLSKGLLAPKPHQEHVTDMDNFVWRFCVIAMLPLTPLLVLLHTQFLAVIQL